MIFKKPCANILILILALILLSVACANSGSAVVMPPTPTAVQTAYTQMPTVTPLPTYPLGAEGTAMAQAQSRATEAAHIALQAEGTRQALSANATMQADHATTIAIQSTNQAIAHTTGTAVSMKTTEQSLAYRATDMALNAIATQSIVDQNLDQTRSAIAMSGTSTAMSNMAELEENLINQEATQVAFEIIVAQREQDRKDNMLLVATALAFILLLAGVAYLLRGLFPRIVKQADGTTIVLVQTDSGLRPVPSTQPKRLPPPSAVPLLTSGISDVQPGTMPLGESANWATFCQWQETNTIPIGLTADGTMTLSFEQKPHLLISGQTGTGKTRRMVWPITAAALNSGANVILVNEKAGDFAPFYHHPNVTVLRGNDDELPLKALNLMIALLHECNRRSEVTQAYGVSTWNRLPAHADPHGDIVVIIDEFLDLTAPDTSLTTEQAKGFMGSMVRLARKGRALGIRMILVAQSPGERSMGKLGLNVRDQCGRITFFLEDAAVSRVVVGSPVATTLPPGYVVTSFGRRRETAVTFSPSQDEVAQYLAQVPTQPKQLPATIINMDSATTRAPLIAHGTSNRHPQESTIRDMIEKGHSQRYIERAVFGYTGGDAYQQVASVLESMNMA